MPKNSSARVRTQTRELAAEQGLSHVAAHFKVTQPAPEDPAAGEDDSATYPYRIVDAQNYGWLRLSGGTEYSGYDPTSSMPRPLTDAQLAELAVQPGQATLSVEQVAAIVRYVPPNGDAPADWVVERVGDPEITSDRVALILGRIASETGHPTYGDTAPRFSVRRSNLEPRPLEEITRHFGAWRPVELMTNAERDELGAAFELAGRKLITSVASALDLLWYEASTSRGGWDAGLGQRTLTAGRPGSWESSDLMKCVWFGNELNLHPYKGRLSVEQMRATGPNLKRVHLEARDRIADVLRAWTASEDRYTEVAESLTFLICHYADEHHGVDGWRKIADQWLQPGSLAQEHFRDCYKLLYSTSAHFDHELI